MHYGVAEDERLRANRRTTSAGPRRHRDGPQLEDGHDVARISDLLGRVYSHQGATVAPPHSSGATSRIGPRQLPAVAA